MSRSSTFALISLPFWAALAARRAAAGTDLVGLIGSLLTRRMDGGPAVDPQLQLVVRASIAAVAQSAMPRSEVAIGDATTYLQEWLGLPGTRRAYGDRNADAIIEAARMIGVLWLDGHTLRFPHPLIATFLAAESVIQQAHLPSGASDELKAFVAAIGPREMTSLELSAIAGATVIGLSQFLRLRSGRDTPVSPRDLNRLSAAAAAIGGRFGLSPNPLPVVTHSGEYWCIELVEGGVVGPDLEKPVVPFTGSGRLTCWKDDPLATTEPETLVVGIALNQFKDWWRTLRPPGHDSGPLDGSEDAVTSQPDFADRLRDFVVAARSSRAEFLERAGLLGTSLDSEHGKPKIAVTKGRGGSTFSVEWGHAETSITVSAGEHWAGQSVGSILADPTAYAYRELTRDIEDLIGSPMYTGAVRTPGALPWAL